MVIEIGRWREKKLAAAISLRALANLLV